MNKKLTLEFEEPDNKKIISYEEFKKKQQEKPKPPTPTPGGAALPVPKKAAMKRESFGEWLVRRDEAIDLQKFNKPLPPEAKKWTNPWTNQSYSQADVDAGNVAPEEHARVRWYYSPAGVRAYNKALATKQGHAGATNPQAAIPTPPPGQQTTVNYQKPVRTEAFA